MIKGQEINRNRLNDRGNNIKKDFENNLNRKNIEKEKLIESKKYNRYNENELSKGKSSNFQDGSVSPNVNNDDRKYFVRNSMIPPNFQNVINNKNQNGTSKINEKEIKENVNKRNSLEQRNQILIESFRNMLKEASSNMYNYLLSK